MPKANYGIDAPTVLRNLSIAAAAGMIVRVLKSGGHAAIFDVRHSYARFFECNGFTIVKKWTTMLFGRSVVARKN